MQNMEIIPDIDIKKNNFLVQLEGFVFKYLKSNAKIEGFASSERIVKIKHF